MSLQNSPLASKRMEQQANRCFLCEQRLHWEDATKEHLIPMQHGGVKGWANIVLAHYECNVRKSGRIPTLEELVRFKQITGSNPAGTKELLRGTKVQEHLLTDEDYKNLEIISFSLPFYNRQTS